MVLSVDSDRELDPGGQDVLDRLATGLRSDTEDGSIRWLRFELSQGCVDVLGEAPGLFAWRQPQRPENLCLLRPDGSPWIVSIAAERIGYVEFTPLREAPARAGGPGAGGGAGPPGGPDAILAAFERRLESEGERLQQELISYAGSVIADGREGLVGALRDWILSGELVRATAAVQVVAQAGPGRAGVRSRPPR